MIRGSSNNISPPIIGCPNDWSLHPLRRELKKFTGSHTLKMTDGKCLQNLLSSHEIEAAACSPLHLLRHPNFELALPLGLSCHGSDLSCYFGLKDDCLDLPEILADRIQSLSEVFHSSKIKTSATIKSAAEFVGKACKDLALPKLKETPKLRIFQGEGAESTLAKILYLLLWGEHAYETNEIISSQLHCSYHGPTIDLLSKNSALQHRCQYRRIIDLSELWFRITGLPFVSMVWQKIKSQHHLASKSLIASAAEKAHARMKIEPSAYYPDIIPLADNLEEIKLSQLWKKQSYKLGTAEIKSMLFFLQLAAPLEKKLLHPEIFTIKMIRWQEKMSISGP